MKVTETKLIRRSKRQLSELKEITSTHESWKKSYFYLPPSSAYGRRSKEFKNSYEFKTNAGLLKVTQELEMSCKNVYYRISITIDGSKKTIKTINSLIFNY